MAHVARQLGYKTPSGYQRYEEEGSGSIGLSFAVKVAKVLAGKGEPPVTRAEVLELAGPELDEVVRYIQGNASCISSDTGVSQSSVASNEGENAMLEKRIDRLIESVGVIKDRLEKLEAAVDALAKDSAGPTEARRTS